MKIKFGDKERRYEISFNGRSVIELRASGKTVSKMLETLTHPEKKYKDLNRILLINGTLKERDIFKKDISVFEKYDVFIIKNAKRFIDDKISEIIKTHPLSYWLLLGKTDSDCVSEDAVVKLKGTNSRFINKFIPCEDLNLKDLKFSASDRDYRISFKEHSAILIRGTSTSGKTVMWDALKSYSIFVSSLLEWNKGKESFLLDSNEKHFGKIAVLGLNDLNWINQFFTIKHVFEKYTTFVIDHADILVNEELEEFIKAHPEKKWVLIGNYKPDFIPDDAVCIWKNQGHKFYNEFMQKQIKFLP